MMAKERGVEASGNEQGREQRPWEPYAVPCGLGTMDLFGRKWGVASFAFRPKDPDAFLRLVGAAYSIPNGQGQFPVLKLLAAESRMGEEPVRLTMDQIAEKAGVSKSTVINTMKSLRTPLECFGGRAVLEKVQDGVWRFDPWVAWRGSDRPLPPFGYGDDFGESIPA